LAGRANPYAKHLTALIPVSRHEYAFDAAAATCFRLPRRAFRNDDTVASLE